MKAMTKVFAIVALLSVSMGGCAYGGVALTADGHAVILRNDYFLWGALRQVSVCQVTTGGLTSCQSADAP